MTRFVVMLALAAVLVTACGGASVELPQTFELPNDQGGVIIVRYPENWTVSETFGTIAFFNTLNVAALDVNTIQEGLVTGLINVISLKTRDSMALREVLDRMRQEDSAPYNPTEFEINGRRAISVEVPGDQRAEYWLITAIDASMFSVTVSVSTPATIARERAVIQAIAGSVTYEEVRAP